MIDPHAGSSGGKSRREFLVNLAMSFGAFLGLGGLMARFAAFLYPVVPPVRMVEVFAGKRDLIPRGGARLFNILPSRVIILDTGTELRAFNAVCTHLGCIIRWHDDVKRFICPCHKGVFDTEGHVVSGPPPRSLEEIKVVVRGDEIYVLLEMREDLA